MSSETRTGPGAWVLAILTAPAVWLERSRGKRRVALIVVYLVIAVALGLVGWRNWALQSIPNVRDPFADLPPPGPQSAMPGTKFSLYQKAVSHYQLLTVNNQQYAQFGLPRERWENASAERLAWLTANRVAIDLWVKAAEMEPEQATGADPAFPLGYFVGNLDLFELCEFEADRLESQGDLAGAWRLHRAVLRSCQDIAASLPGNLSNQITWSVSSTLGSNLSRWVGDPRVTPAMLDAAREDIKAIADRPLVDPRALRMIYNTIIEQLENPSDLLVHSAREDMNPPGDQMLWYHTFPPTRWARWFLLNEPERGKRVTRLIFANYREYFEAPGVSRSTYVPYTIPWVTDPRSGGLYGNLVLYDDGKAAPSRALSPKPYIQAAPVPTPLTPGSMLPPGMRATPGTFPGPVGSTSALPSKLSVIALGLESSPLLRRVLLSQQEQLPYGAVTVQATLDGIIGLIDGEIALRKLPQEEQDASRDLINPDAPAIGPEDAIP